MEQQTLNFEPLPPSLPVRSTYCPCCHTRLNIRQERITPGLCRTLRKFYEVIQAKGVNSANPRTDCGFTNSQHTNFQKLKYFYLVGQTNKSGYWHLTERGAHFVEGKTVVARKVYVQNKRVVGWSDDRVTISQALGEMPYWLKKADYVSA